MLELLEHLYPSASFELVLLYLEHGSLSFSSDLWVVAWPRLETTVYIEVLLVDLNDQSVDVGDTNKTR